MSVFDVKLVLLGSSSCGKSALLHRLVYGRYRPGLPPTYGAEFGAKRVEVAVPSSGSGANGSEREERSRGAGSRASSAVGGGGDGGGSGRRGASVGIWDTSGAARFHSQSRRFIAGADAVLVCWDASSRDSWEAMRAWVADARAEDPAVRIYLAACKSDLVLRHDQVAHMDVQVERWSSQEQQRHHRGQLSGQLSGQQQPQHDLRQRSLQQQGSASKPPLHGGAPSGLPERVPAAPRTPLKAERPQSPEEELEAEAEAALVAAGGGHAEAAAAAAARQVIAEHRAAAAAELVSSLTGQSLPSPFAAVAARPLTPTEEPAVSSPGSPTSAVSTRGSSLPAMLSSSAPAGRAESAEGGTAEQAHPGRRRSGPPHVRLQSASPEEAAVGRQQGQGSESEELPSPPPAPLQQPAVPEAAVEQYCTSLGTRMFWVSARTGEGVLDAVMTIAQVVVDQRLLVWRLQQAQQAQQQAQQAQQQGSRRSPWGSLHGGSLATQQAQQAQRGRSRSADSYGGQQATAGASSLSSRGRAARRGASASGSSVRSASAGQAAREYVVRGSELGSPPRQPEEPSCVIC